MNDNTLNRNNVAILLMVLGTIAWSLIPLVVDQSNSKDNPFIFNTLYNIFASVGILIYLLVFHRRAVSSSAIWSTIYSATRSEGLSKRDTIGYRSGRLHIWLKQAWESNVFLSAAVGRFSLLFLAWSTSYIDVAVSAILYETWVIWFIILRSWSSPDRASKLSAQTWILIIFGFIGLGYVNLSRNEVAGDFFNIGTILALVGGLLAAVNVERSLKWGENIRNTYFDRQDIEDNNSEDSHNLELVFTMLGVVALNLLSALVTFVAGVIDAFDNSEESVWFSGDELLWISIGGVVIGTSALVLFRKANIMTTFPEINAISYVAPALSVVALILFSEISLQRFDYFILGVSILIAVNTLVNFISTEQGSSFNWLVVALWTSGMFVLLRDEWLSSWLPGNWIWEIEVGEYFTLIGLSATVFILILSFRTSRISALIDREEQLAFSLFERLRRIDNKAAEVIREIDMSTSKRQLQVKLSEIRGLLAESTEEITDDELVEINKDLNFLVYSKVKGRELTEPIVLILFAIITVTLTLATRPEVVHLKGLVQVASWTGFMIDLFSALFSAAIVFLTVNLFDLWKERKSSVFDSIISTDLQLINRPFGNILEQVISILLAFGMTVVVFVLLYGKWMSFWW